MDCWQLMTVKKATLRMVIVLIQTACLLIPNTKLLVGNSSNATFWIRNTAKQWLQWLYRNECFQLHQDRTLPVGRRRNRPIADTLPPVCCTQTEQGSGCIVIESFWWLWNLWSQGEETSVHWKCLKWLQQIGNVLAAAPGPHAQGRY